MNNSTWQRAKAIFYEARGLSIDKRAAFLNDKCAEAEELRSEVEKLLASYDSDFLEETAFGAAEVLTESELQPGQVIGRYHINELIGSGGMGQVFLAYDTELNRPVAFKVLHREVAEDQERVRRFIQEARAASALNHPNILTIHEIGAFEGCRFIVSEYVEGETLRERMKQGITVAESVDITCQVATALQAAHSAGIVHRDIKPENVMIRRDALVKVLDFGLAKLTEADDHPIDSNAPNAPIASAVLTNPGLVMGTVAYMSPEQARGNSVDSRTDLWSLGVVFHEMLTGKSPFEGDSVTDIITSILKTETTLPTSDNLPPELQPICKRALAKKRESRYQSAHDLLKDLQGEKKRMEYAIETTPYISLSGSAELKTQLIRPRPTLSAEYLASEISKTVRQSTPAQKFATLGAIALIVTVAIGLSVYKFNGTTPPNRTPRSALINPSTTEKDLKFSKLPISGQTNEAAISPDGKYVAYFDPKGMHLLELATSDDVVILAIPPADAAWGLKFSPDGKFVYYVYRVSADPTGERIMRIPIHGGTPATVIGELPEYDVGFSPDGSTMAFVRELRGGLDGVELVLANADGSNKRTLTKTAPGVGISNSPMFSPDGKTIACETWFKEANSSYFKIVGFSLDAGEQRSISDKKWANMFGGVWLPNGNLIVSGIESSSETQLPSQLWIISPDGQTRAFTSGLLGYQGLSATRDGSIILSNQGQFDNNLWLIPNNDTSKARQVTTSGEIGGGFTATPDGRIVFGSRVTGNIELWLMNADGSGRKRLTNEGARNRQPVVSPDNKYIVFNSDRGDGKPRLYRMGLDGQNVKRLTEDANDIFPQSRLSGDGKWVYYMELHDGNADTIKKLPIDGGEPLVVMSAPDEWEFTALDINRADGRIACGLTRKPNGPREYKIGIVPANGKAFTRLIDLPSDLSSSSIRWMPDGRSLATLGKGLAIEVWRIPIDGKGKPSKLTDFRTSTTYNFNWSIDGKFMLVARGTRRSEAILIRTSAN